MTTFGDKHLISENSLISDFILLVLPAVICIPLSDSFEGTKGGQTKESTKNGSKKQQNYTTSFNEPLINLNLAKIEVRILLGITF